MRPPSLCICSVLPKERLVTKTDVLILQHPNERRKKNLSTVPLLKLVLENVSVKVGYSFSLGDLPKEKTPLLLYPGNDAVPLDQPTETPNSLLSDLEDRVLIIFDGTWTEAKRMARDSPSLQSCQQVQFTQPNRSIYDAVRKEPEEHCLSTLEATAKALAYLEENNVASNCLEKALQHHVDTHLINAKENAVRSAGRSQRKLFEKNKRRREIEIEVFGLNVPTKKTPNYVRLDDGATIRPLRVSDAETVNSLWEYRDKKSLELIRRRIQLDNGEVCLGVELDGRLVAWIVRYEGGALGMLHCDEAHRRKGYASELLSRATKILKERNEECVAFIVDGNSASEALFTKNGWVRENPKAKKGTGRRKAKRKWIRPLNRRV